MRQRGRTSVRPLFYFAETCGLTILHSQKTSEILSNDCMIHRTTYLLGLLSMLLSIEQACGQWKEVKLSAPFNSGYYLDVYFLPENPDYGWVCSMEGHIVRTTDGGASWQGTTIPGSFLEYVQFINRNTGFVSGPAGVFRSDDGGQTWLDISPNTPIGENGWGSYWLNDRVGVYFVGGCLNDQQSFYRTTDGGLSWTVSYGYERSSGLSDGFLYEDGSGYAISSGVLWGTSDYGRSWFKISNTGPRNWNEEISVFGRSILIPSAGQSCDGQSGKGGSLRYSTDGGATWREYLTGQNMYGCFLLSATTAWGVGDNRTVLYTEDAGKSWLNRNCGIRGNIDDIWFVTDTLAWAVGQGIYRSSFNSKNSAISITPTQPVVAICPGDSLFVQASGPFGEYTWNDNVVAPSRVLRDTGTYIVRAYDSLVCLFVSDTIRIVSKSTYKPQITSTARSVCDGDTITLSVDRPAVTYKWSTGETTRDIRVTTTGLYTCSVLDSSGCTQTTPGLNIVVNALPKPTIIANRSVVLCLDDTVDLATSKPYRSYRWSTGSTGTSIRVASSGKYVVTVIDSNGCSGTSDSIEVTVLNTRNRAEFLFDSGGNTYVIESHDVGALRCRSIRIRNRSDIENLVIDDIHFVGNVFFSAPQAQFPIIVGPLQTGTLEVCASAQDTGRIADTLALADTCSVILIPFESRGLPIILAGQEKCGVDVVTMIIRAGGAWRLRAPYPVPASKFATFAIRPPEHYAGRLFYRLLDSRGQMVRQEMVLTSEHEIDLMIPVSDLTLGVYYISLADEQGIIASTPILVVP